MADTNENVRTQHFSISHFIIRLIVGAVVLVIAQALTPGFAINSLWSLLLAAVVLAVLDYLVQRVLGVDATPFGRGISGFIVAALILYVIKFIVPGYSITLFGAILGALVYGIVDLIIPGRAM
ncbi:MAG: phage holin family protein [Desulfitobacterium hafniense]|nr:phage holin family protein [Desulfitobacterium hafniense]